MADINLALTAKGQTLKAKIEKGEGTIPLTITRVVTASGTSPEPLNLNAVVDERQEFSILSRKVAGNRTSIAVSLTNMGNPFAGVAPLDEGYQLTQIGFYAEDPDEGEILYRISQFDKPNYVPAATESGWVYERTFNFITGNASDVNITVDPYGFPMKSDIYASVELSDQEPPEDGVRTHYHIESDAPSYTHEQPDDGLIFQGMFDPTTGEDGEGTPIPPADGSNIDYYWEASAAGDFTPPGEVDPLTFEAGDRLVSDGLVYYHLPPPEPSLFAGAKIAEIRVVDDPEDTTKSPCSVVLPKTVLEAVIDPVTGSNAGTMFTQATKLIDTHVKDINVHVTATWKSGIQQAIDDVLALSQTNAGNINTLTGRIKQVEDSIYIGLTDNPFTVSFDTLTDIIVIRGVWNSTKQYIEC